MGKRSYGQHCTVARALDVVGERWTLLLVRELMTGPKRFKDLLDGLPGIGTNLLASRLKALEGHGVVGRATLPPPAGSGVYELTGLGRSLGPVVVALSRWGAKLEDGPQDGYERRPAWAATALLSLAGSRPSDGPREFYEFRIDDEPFCLRTGGGAAEVRQGPAEAPAAVVSGGSGVILSLSAGRLAAHEALETGELSIEGEPDARERCLRMLTPATAATPQS